MNSAAMSSVPNPTAHWVRPPPGIDPAGLAISCFQVLTDPAPAA